MNKRALSVTLAPDSIAWLRARATATGARSVSETLDRIIAAARASESSTSPGRSVVGLVHIPTDDPDLELADRAVKALFATPAPTESRKRTPRGRPRARRLAGG